MKTIIFLRQKGLFSFLLFCIFMGNNHILFAQIDNETCLLIDSSPPVPTGTYSHSIDPAFLEDCEPIVLNIYFWGIKHPNGETYYPNRAHDVLQTLANLNIALNPFGIFFKYRGYEEIVSPITYWDQDGDGFPDPDPDGHFVLENIAQFTAMINWAASNGYKKADAFNVYAYGWSTGFGGVAYMWNTVSALTSNNLGIGHNHAHEIAHNLGIYHTRAKGNGSSDKEHTTRDQNDPNNTFNATTADDELVDTAANTEYYHGGTYPYITPACGYDGNETDEEGFVYNISPEDVQNAMSDAHPCVNNNLFTMGQAIRMHESLNSGIYDHTLTTVSALYEPYAGFYPEYYPHPEPWRFPLFQPGFNYRFVECECELNLEGPVPYEYTAFNYTNTSLLTIDKYETDFESIAHPNHTAIAIDLGGYWCN